MFHILSRNFFGSPSSIPISTHILFLSDLRGADNSPSVYLRLPSPQGSLEVSPRLPFTSFSKSCCSTWMPTLIHLPCLFLALCPIALAPLSLQRKGSIMAKILGSTISLPPFIPLTTYLCGLGQVSQPVLQVSELQKPKKIIRKLHKSMSLYKVLWVGNIILT